MILDRYSFKPIYLQLAEKMQADIVSGKHQPDSQLPPEEELSQEFDVSRNTMRNTLKKLENEGLIYRVRGKGTFISPAGRKQKVLIGVLSLSPQGHQTVQSLTTGAFMRAQEEHGQFQLIHETQLEKTIEAVKNNPALQAGVIFLHSDIMNPLIIKSLEDAGIPYIVEGRTITGCNYLDIDNYGAMKQVTEHLLGLGHRRFGLFMRDRTSTDHFTERQRGVIDTLKN